MKNWLFIAVVGTLLTNIGFGQELKLAALFCDNMVLQQGKKIPVWGFGQEGETVSVQLDNQTAGATVSKGRWQVALNSMKEGGPYQLTVRGSAKTITLENVLVGEVWLASGQSNMEMNVAGCARAELEAASADFPNLRMFTVTKATSLEPKLDVQGRWEVCTPNTVNNFSAVGFFFARHLYQNGVKNIGIIHSSWGGTPAEAWTDKPTLAADSLLSDMLKPLQWFKKGESGKEMFQQRMDEFFKFSDEVYDNKDDYNQGWANFDIDASQWKKALVPQKLEVSPFVQMDGVIWYRKEVSLDDKWSGKELVLELGAIDDFDITFFNGVEVGRTDRQVRDSHAFPRVYTIPAGLVRPGRNVITVRAMDNLRSGGFTSDPQVLKLSAKDKSLADIPLAGEWLMRIVFTFDNKTHPQRPLQANESQVATMLYNAMIAPLIPYGICGAIWYQGESNAGRAFQYRTLFPKMITCWRQNWQQGDFPFYFVQLANFMDRNAQPSESEWAELREAQLRTLSLKNTGMAVIIDIGERADIHPRNKQDVGKRLALIAENKVYGKKVLFSGPLYKSMKAKNGKIELSFKYTDGGLKIKGEKLEGFAIAGVDRQFIWADAVIKGDKVICSSPQIEKPVAVRYAWDNNPDANLYNSADLPASPFRTDDFPMITRYKR